MNELLLSIAKYVALGAAGWMLWTLRNAFAAGFSIQKFLSRFEGYQRDNDRALVEAKRDADREIALLKQRLDVAGKAMSDIASDVQGLPERMRTEFLPRRESELIQAESKVDRQRLWDETRDIWKVVNRREDGKGHR